MNKTLLIMAHEIRMTLGRKMFLLMGFGLPLVVAIIALVIIFNNRNGGGGIETPVETPAGLPEGYVDPAGLIQQLPPDAPEDWLVPFASESEAQAALEAESISGYALIPADYLTSGEITYVKLSHNPLDGSVNVRGIEWVLFHNLYEGSAADAARAWSPLEVTAIALNPPEPGEIGESWINRLLPNIMAIILYLVIIMSASVLVQAVTDEKKYRVLELALSSVSANQFITGKLVGVGLLGMLQFLAWLGVLVLVIVVGGSDLNIPAGFELPTGMLLWATLFSFLGYLLYGSQMAGLGALVPDLKDSRGAAFVVLIPLIIVYMFLIFLIEAPNSPVSVAMSLFPLTAPVGMIARMAATDVPLWQVALSAAGQLLAALLIIRLTARLFRAQVLLSGQPFSLRRYYGLMLRG